MNFVDALKFWLTRAGAKTIIRCGGILSEIAELLKMFPSQRFIIVKIESAKLIIS